MELKSAQLSGNDERMRQALSDGATAAQSTVRVLRDLANGLHPAALADGGLRATLVNIFSRAIMHFSSISGPFS